MESSTINAKKISVLLTLFSIIGYTAYSAHESILEIRQDGKLPLDIKCEVILVTLLFTFTTVIIASPLRSIQLNKWSHQRSDLAFLNSRTNFLRIKELKEKIEKVKN
ncbi:ER membrane protein complex subunit Emc5 [Schizosaccharomyces pombe]|uniref:ER membrane protein complex subunit 5 n=1 Tax=Schizosaccharomyces pombe (strain 972 / ATCC 24843) TaxID=284812 RepID=EMC5_SCHPO|nr:uncharacterized protein SPAP4C9.02 [Schizosaccharomyces pombe]C6Y4A7.1 RecName: Full=ER membrane protein complex subunit 5 [Schizosaccharomyces pombe 972h-]CBA11503.1 ER membrane protein complex subunit 5 (predicted) [Schizosaccharomyces pombe]|eukprot:NP_001343078.1 uncharacterized protein SPAP4C9.02 [Schizosaccharomyces pombe]